MYEGTICEGYLKIEKPIITTREKQVFTLFI